MREVISSTYKNLRKDLESDVFFLSAPKSGRTWVSVMLCMYFHRVYHTPPQFSVFEKEVAHQYGLPYIRFSHDTLTSRRNKFYSLIPRTFRIQNKKIIFLVRDPRDVAVSLFHHLTKRQSLWDGHISVFIRNETFGMPALVSFLNEWQDLLERRGNYLLLHYENIHHHPKHSLETLLSFIGIEETFDESLSFAIEDAQFENMRRLEEVDGMKSKSLRYIGSGNARKVRKGQIGSYMEELSEPDISFLNKYMSENLKPGFGYLS